LPHHPLHPVRRAGPGGAGRAHRAGARVRAGRGVRGLRHGRVQRSVRGRARRHRPGGGRDGARPGPGLRGRGRAARRRARPGQGRPRGGRRRAAADAALPDPGHPRRSRAVRAQDRGDPAGRPLPARLARTDARAGGRAGQGARRDRAEGRRGRHRPHPALGAGGAQGGGRRLHVLQRAADGRADHGRLPGDRRRAVLLGRLRLRARDRDRVPEGRLPPAADRVLRAAGAAPLQGARVRGRAGQGRGAAGRAGRGAGPAAAGRRRARGRGRAGGADQARSFAGRYGMIRDLTVTQRTVALHRPWGPDVPANHVLVVEVALDDGRVGTGFSWTPQIGARAVRALLEHDIRDALIGLDAHPEVVWDLLWRHLREAGPGGITTIALAGVDLALWDLRCGERGLADVLGRRRDSVPVYGSGVNLHYPLEELVAQAGRWKAAGYPAVKIKVGRPDLREDVERVAAVREVIGPDTLLMVDANQRWDLFRARRAADALAPYGLHWLEEPLPADDVAAHVELRRSTHVPIAVG